MSCREGDSPNGVVSSFQITEETTTTKRRQLSATSLLLPTLPFDLLIEILSRLPVKLLSQLRCVCKSFNSLISDSKFAKKHLRLSTTLHRLVVSGHNSELVLFDTPIPSDFLTSSITQSQFNYPNSLKIGSASPLYVSSCDGILCFTMKQGSAVLWNPSIRKSKILSSLSLNDTWGEGDPRMSLSAYTFGYDPFIHNYKIVAISVFKDKSEVSVCTLGIDDWRRIQDFPYFGPCGPGIFVSGTVNWVIGVSTHRLICVNTSDRVIVSLDLKKEMYQKLPQPDL
ncbi:F-box/kelch-repeat protein, partial [Trifolium medium]|nr:F-box/kelch-repeat protein [Trifolium medium]